MRRHSRLWTLAGLLAGTVTFGSPQVAAAAISFVQANASTNDAAASTIAQAFTTANTTGNLIVVAVTWGDNAAPSIRATDTLGNTYAITINDFDPGNRQGLAILYAPNIRAGANTVTVTLGTTGGYRRIMVSEYSGIATTAPFDVAAHNRAGGTTAANGVTSTAATTTANGDLIFGVAMDDSGSFGTITAGTGFTVRATLNAMDMAIEDRIQATAGSVAATFTFSRADIYFAQMAAFKAAAGGGGTLAVSSLVCNPTSLNPGASTTCTVTLNQPAPTGGSTVTLASDSTTATVTVAPTLTLTSLAVTPTNPSIVTGGTQQFTATGTFSDGSTQDLTTSVTWASSVTAVATISNTTGSQGRATAVGTGSTTISATSGSVSGSTVLTVTGGGGGAPISFVQANASTNDAVASTIAQAFTTANTAGNLIVVAVSWGDNAAPSIRATDT